MKKRTERRILALLITAILICSVSVCAAADNALRVTVKSNDTLVKICQANGIDYYKNKDAIMRLNGITDPKKLDSIRVGDVIVLPASSAPASGAANNTAANSAVQPAAIIAGSAANAPAGDTAAYYLTYYTVESGDILNDVYGAWGMNFNSYASVIQSLNGLSDLNCLTVGRTLLLPVNRADIMNGAVYTVMMHSVVAGDTTDGICHKYGLIYVNAQATLRMFNPGIDFNRINIGQKIYIPVTAAAQTPVQTTAAASVYQQNQSYQMQAAAAQNIIQQQAQTQQQPAVQTQTQQLPVIGSVYDGYAVVVDYGSYLHLRLETTGTDVLLNLTPTVLNGYFPRVGDYVKCTFTSSDNILSYIKYGYNVFSGQ